MDHNCETLSDDNGFEILASYSFQKEKSYYEEPGNPETFVEPMVYTELHSVELLVAGRGIDILPLLTEKEKSFIISKLTYEC